jgi:hypothetical protein
MTTDPKTVIPLHDPFDPENLRLDQSFTENTGVKKLLTTVPVRKPKPQDFVRVHPSEDYRTNVGIIEVEDERESYLVTPNTATDLRNELRVKTLFTAITRQGVPFLLPVPVASPDARILEWHRSLREGAETAMHKWVRIRANMGAGAYDVEVAIGTIPEPIWPDLPYKELLRIAFRDRYIDRLDHPVIRQLRGE